MTASINSSLKTNWIRSSEICLERNNALRCGGNGTRAYFTVVREREKESIFTCFSPENLFSTYISDTQKFSYEIPVSHFRIPFEFTSVIDNFFLFVEWNKHIYSVLQKLVGKSWPWDSRSRFYSFLHIRYVK